MMTDGLNNIELTPWLTASLYPTSLIETNSDSIIEKKQTATPLPPSTKKWLGENKRNILVVVDNRNITHLSDEDLSFLTSILSACKLDLGDVAIVNANNFPGHNYKNYMEQFKSQTILLFGIDPSGFGLPLDFPQFQVQSFANSTFLHSPPLGQYDKLLKSKLWVCLKKIFNL